MIQEERKLNRAREEKRFLKSENRRQLKANWASRLRRQLVTVEPGEAEPSQRTYCEETDKRAHKVLIRI